MKPLGGTDPRRFDQVRRIFEVAQDLIPSERATFLENACVGDPELRSSVERLLAADLLEDDDFLRPPHDGSARPRPAHDDLTPGTRVGVYRIEEPIGEGGWSVVHRAERVDDVYSQQVAIKVLKRGLDTEEMLRRFELERQTLAQLEHPHIARLLDGGRLADGRPYLVMEFVEGDRIDRWCDDRSLGVRARVELFRHACDAVQFAHQHLIVHRDLKPGNLLVGRDGQPKLLDFGIAKLLDPSAAREMSQHFGHLRGPMTVETAAPEQVQGKPVTTATDVYSLGHLLYRLLTGVSPYPAASGRAELERQICEVDPVRPSEALPSGFGGSEGVRRRWSRALRGDLDRIVGRAMRKEPEQRYSTAAQLADDLGRHLRGEPVHARGISFRYRISKFIGRNRVASVAILLALLALGGGFWATAAQVVIASRERDHAIEEQRRATRIKEFLQGMLSSLRPEEQGREISVRQALDEVAGSLEIEFAEDPPVLAELHLTVGQSFVALGLHDPGRMHLERARDLLDEIAAPAADRAIVLNNLAALDYRRGLPEIAAEEFETVVALLRQDHGSADHEDVAQGLNNLGASLLASRDLDRGAKAHEEALAMRRRLFPDPSLEIAESLNNLSHGKSALGDLDEAARLAQECLSMREALLPPDHPLHLQILNNIGTLHLLRGENAEAAALIRRAVPGLVERLGEHHPSLVQPLLTLARALRLEGEFVRAEEVAEQAREIAISSLEEGGWLRTLASAEHGLTLLTLGRDLEGQERLGSVIEDLCSRFAPGNPKLGAYLDPLYTSLERTGQGSRAAEIRARCSPPPPTP